MEPSTLPSILMTPSVSMLPSMVVPAAMIERELLPESVAPLASSAPLESLLLKIAICRPPVHERRGIHIQAGTPHLEVQVGGEGARVASGEADGRPGGHAIARRDANVARVGVDGLVPVAVRDSNELPV